MVDGKRSRSGTCLPARKTRLGDILAQPRTQCIVEQMGSRMVGSHVVSVAGGQAGLDAESSFYLPLERHADEHLDLALLLDVLDPDLAGLGLYQPRVRGLSAISA